MKNMSTRLFVPPFGIQKTYIATTNVGSLNKLYDIDKPSFSNLCGAGTGLDKQKAIDLSVFEAIERLSNTICSVNVIIDTYNNLKNKCYNMEKFPQVADYENSFNLPFVPDNVTGWVETLNLCDAKNYLIPQSYVFLNNEPSFLGDRITNPISTGVALHDSYIEAVISGIYEVVERDGIALTWLLGNVNYCVNHIFTDFENIFSTDFLGEVNYYDVSTVEGIITICVHAKSYHSNKVKNVLMFVSDVDIQNIKKKLFKELISVMSSFANGKEFNDDTDFTHFTSVEQSGAFMALSKNDSNFDFLKDIPNALNKEYPIFKFSTKKDELAYLKKIISNLGYDILVTDITSREAKSKNYKVVKVIIPQLQPISFVYSSRYLSSKRLSDYMKKLGIKEINNMPLAFS